MANLSDHPLIRQSYEVSQAIEACGASTQLTAAVIKSSDLTEAISRLVHEQCLTGPTCVPLDGLQPHEQRVVLEKAQLDERLRKLKSFIQAENGSYSERFLALPDEDRDLLFNQATVMGALSNLLMKRVTRMVPKPSASDELAAQAVRIQGGLPDGDFPLGSAAKLDGENTCEACQ